MDVSRVADEKYICLATKGSQTGNTERMAEAVAEGSATLSDVSEHVSLEYARLCTKVNSDY